MIIKLFICAPLKNFVKLREKGGVYARNFFAEESMKRFKVLEEVKFKRIGAKEGVMLLGLSYRHFLRLKKRYSEDLYIIGRSQG